jgi:hypothetical protein
MQVYHFMKLVDDGEEMKREEGSGRPWKLTVEDERKVLRAIENKNGDKLA